ncbi:MAG: hypothetical protein K2K14_02565 [Ruminococcus sp.]|nr:hypothetical protein [Ruminococcus sp.]
MRKLVSAATSLVMAATMVSAVAPVVAGAADAKKGLSILTYKDAELPSGVTAEGATVKVSADAIKAGDVKVPLAVYLNSETPDVKTMSFGATVRSDNADAAKIKFEAFAPGKAYFSEDKTYTLADGTECTTNKILSFAGSYSKRAGFSPNGNFDSIAAKESNKTYGADNAYLGVSWISGGSKYEWIGKSSDEYPIVVFDVTLPKGTAEGEYLIDYTDVLADSGNPVCLVETVDKYDNLDHKNLDLNTLTIKVGESAAPAATTTTPAATTTVTTTAAKPDDSTTTTAKPNVDPVKGDFVLDFDNPDSEDGYWHANAGESVDVDMHITADQSKKVTSFSVEVAVEGGITFAEILDISPAFSDASVLSDLNHGTSSAICKGPDSHGIIVNNDTMVMYTFDIPAGTPDGLYALDITYASLTQEDSALQYDGVAVKRGYIQVGDSVTPPATTTTKPAATTTTAAPAATTTTAKPAATTTTATPAATTTATQNPSGSSTPLYGDTNCDKQVRINDVVLLNKYLNDAKSYNITDQGKLNADCYNPKGGAELTAEDSKAIIQSIVHLVELPVNK